MEEIKLVKYYSNSLDIKYKSTIMAPIPYKISMHESYISLNSSLSPFKSDNGSGRKSMPPRLRKIDSWLSIHEFIEHR
jgi:hypothetical protein